MTKYWAYMRDFLILNFGRLCASRKNATFPHLTGMPEPLPVSWDASRHEPHEETAIGYEAGWAGFSRAR